MAYQILNNTEQFVTIRTKVNSNFALTESISNKVLTISSTPSDSKYPSEKAVSDYASKIYSSSSIPTSKSGDLLLHINASISTGGSKGKLKHNTGGSLTEFIPDRSVCDYRSASAWSSATPSPVLLAGEIGIESDTNKQKIGNGSTPWNSLAYAGSSGSSGILGVKLSADVIANGAYMIAFNTPLPGHSTSTDFATLSSGRATIQKSGIYLISGQFHQSDGFSEGVFAFGIHVGSSSMSSPMGKGFESYAPVSLTNPKYCGINASGAVYLDAGDTVYAYVVPPPMIGSGDYRLDADICKMTIAKIG